MTISLQRFGWPLCLSASVSLRGIWRRRAESSSHWPFWAILIFRNRSEERRFPSADFGCLWGDVQVQGEAPPTLRRQQVQVCGHSPETQRSSALGGLWSCWARWQLNNSTRPGRSEQNQNRSESWGVWGRNDFIPFQTSFYGITASGLQRLALNDCSTTASIKLRFVLKTQTHTTQTPLHKHN